MIPLPFPTVLESGIKQLPQVDLTFGIGDIVGSIALLVSAFTFYISFTQASQSEQIKTSRDIWAGIRDRVNKVEKSVASQKPDYREIMDCLSEIEYFAYLILEKEIKDKIVLDYYKAMISKDLPYIFFAYFSYCQNTKGEETSHPEYNLFDHFQHIVILIEKWDIGSLSSDVKVWHRDRAGAIGHKR